MADRLKRDAERYEVPTQRHPDRIEFDNAWANLWAGAVPNSEADATDTDRKSVV